MGPPADPIFHTIKCTYLSAEGGAAMGSGGRPTNLEYEIRGSDGGEYRLSTEFGGNVCDLKEMLDVCQNGGGYDYVDKKSKILVYHYKNEDDGGYIEFMDTRMPAVHGCKVHIQNSNIVECLGSLVAVHNGVREGTVIAGVGPEDNPSVQDLANLCTLQEEEHEECMWAADTEKLPAQTSQQPPPCVLCCNAGPPPWRPAQTTQPPPRALWYNGEGPPRRPASLLVPHAEINSGTRAGVFPCIETSITIENGEMAVTYTPRPIRRGAPNMWRALAEAARRGGAGQFRSFKNDNEGIFINQGQLHISLVGFDRPALEVTCPLTACVGGLEYLADRVDFLQTRFGTQQ